MTTGDIIALCDQDDVWMEDKLQVLSNLFEAYPDAQSISSSFSVIDEGGREMPVQQLPGRANNNLIRQSLAPGSMTKMGASGQDPFFLLGYNISPGCTMSITKCIRDAYLTSGLRKIPHDWELNILAHKQGAVYFYAAPLIAYRVHGNNAIGLSVGS